jgi:phosphoglycolate phosphatase-like HAD superfamily hydrolase
VLAKWQVPPDEVAYVGDTAYDLKAASEAHVIPLGAAWAATAEVNNLRALAPLTVFDQVEEFIRWIDQGFAGR